ncbi:Trafficking protein particle complex subunit 13 [Tolypocladium paradoxum]|uniref:Trafficking protein particle complex subunit 13 n=1 Tax=Tolypocladium paradoxum TaxID=94208 RepID=A0A2S4L6U0_9HYPO|nr:Trafficking protein particle complex subunit 13 [Tolypocladium paradoxum]
MSHQRYPSHDPVKEPHSVSVKVLRQALSRPSLVTQYPVEPPLSPPLTKPAPAPGSLAYRSSSKAADTTATNPEPFLLSPILNLPVSFGSAYVGETFSCTLCANNDLPAYAPKQIRDVRIEAEMKTPGLGAAHKLSLGPGGAADAGGTDLDAGGTLQRVISFDLKEEGNHVLAVTVSYYEATETSGRTRTFRKLYQFICKASLIVRTKIGPLDLDLDGGAGSSRWVLEAQLENCSEDVVQLEKVAMELVDGFACRDCNWESSGSDKPVLHPGEVEQVCFVVEETEKRQRDEDMSGSADGRITFGVLGIGWRGEMGNRGFLSTGKLGTRMAR